MISEYTEKMIFKQMNCILSVSSSQKQDTLFCHKTDMGIVGNIREK